MKNQLKIIFAILFFFTVYLSSGQTKKDSTALKNKNIFKTFYFMPFVNQVLALTIDSTYYTKSNFTATKKYPLFKRTDVVKVNGFSHCSESQLEFVNPKKATDKLFLLTDGLAIVNTDACPPNKVELPANEIDSLLKIFGNKKLFQKMPGGGSNCFFPRHTFLFYDKNNKVIGFMEICFQCDMVLTSSNLIKRFEGNFIGEGEKKLKELCKRVGISVSAL
ncbi:MAG: hypothetical protein IAF38_09635 [Bacteroidia bacterium]|nr:hypothetical protein [Bacteroidia bacterium]